MLPVLLFATVRCDELKEPDVDICIIKDADTMVCIPQLGTRPEYEREISIGLFCVDDDSYTGMKKHHEQLHRIIDEGKKKRVSTFDE